MAIDVIAKTAHVTIALAMLLAALELGCAGSEASQIGSGGDTGSGDSGGSGATTGSGGSQGSGGSITVGPVIEPDDPGPGDVEIVIRSDRDLHPISELIYGYNGCDKLASNGYGLCRSGGNRMTAYNWENNASNAGSDYLFQNDGYLSSSNEPGAAVRPLLEAVNGVGAAVILTIPNVDYVAADKNGGGDVRNSGADYLTTRFKQNRPKKGASLSTTPEPNDSYVYQDEFVHWVKSTAPSTRVLFSMDNEPDLWASTHAEVHPDKVQYAELVTRNTDFAKAVKGVWPEAEVTGFVSYGWYGYVTLQDAPDGGGRDFIDFYLDQIKLAESANGKRLIDYLDLHWYSEATGGGIRINDFNPDNRAALTTEAVVLARLQAPRSLWDPSYTEDSWIATDGLGGEAIQLIPRLLDKIANHYPGMKLAFTEWDYGAGWHISGGIACADVLGIFGQKGVAMAAYWPLYEDESFTQAAFRAFRNYDGNGARFGDTSIHAATSNAELSSAYASIDASNIGRLILVAINKQTSELVAAIRIAHSFRYESAAIYTLTEAGGATLVSAPALSSLATNAFSYTMPARSVSVLEFEK